MKSCSSTIEHVGQDYTHFLIQANLCKKHMPDEPDDKSSQKSERELVEKFNDQLRKEGFTEVQIAKIDTAVRRALSLL